LALARHKGSKDHQLVGDSRGFHEPLQVAIHVKVQSVNPFSLATAVSWGFLGLIMSRFYVPLVAKWVIQRHSFQPVSWLVLRKGFI